MIKNFNEFWKDILGILIHPGVTLAKRMMDKRWIPVFCILIVIVFIFTFYALPEQMKQFAVGDQIPDNYSELLQNLSKSYAILAGAWSVLSMMVSITMGSFFIYLFYGIGGSNGVYGNHFSLVVNASVIDILSPKILWAISQMLSIPLLKYTNLSFLSSSLGTLSLGDLFLVRIDIFGLWYIFAISMAVAKFSNLNVKKCLAIGFVYYSFRILVTTLFLYLVQWMTSDLKFID